MKKPVLIISSLILIGLIVFSIFKLADKPEKEEEDNTCTRFERNTRPNYNTQTGMYHPEYITFQVEELERPHVALKETAVTDIYKNMIQENTGLYDHEIENNKINIPYGITEQYEGPDKLVNYGQHSFFSGMYKAYGDHRPFVLSPDIMWLLISQGFAQHVNNNPEELRKLFVDFQGQRSLIVYQEEPGFRPIKEFFPKFSELIAKNTNKELVDILTADFSTTTPTSKVVSEIVIMEATKPYFEFIGAMYVCGIPEITLEGTPGDWKKLLDKTLYLKKYNLDWWIDKLEPILKEFVNASEGKVDKAFWQKIFKIKKAEICGDPDVVNGWVTCFFPYYENGQRTDLKEISMDDKLAPEIVKVDMTYVIIDGTQKDEVPLEIWGGIMGLRQDTVNFALKPEIGWFIRKKDGENTAAKTFQIKEKEGGISIRIKTVPDEILGMKRIKFLDLFFVDKVNIPDELAKVRIDKMYIYGELSKEEENRIVRLFPKTELNINGTEY